MKMKKKFNKKTKPNNKKKKKMNNDQQDIYMDKNQNMNNKKIKNNLNNQNLFLEGNNQNKKAIFKTFKDNTNNINKKDYKNEKFYQYDNKENIDPSDPMFPLLISKNENIYLQDEKNSKQSGNNQIIIINKNYNTNKFVNNNNYYDKNDKVSILDKKIDTDENMSIVSNASKGSSNNNLHYIEDDNYKPNSCNNINFSKFSDDLTENTDKKITSYKDYLNLENELLLKNYGSQFFMEIKKQEQKIRYTNLLRNHKITSQLRTKMVDWMLEVLNTLNYSPESFFQSVHIMDTYLNYYTECLTDRDVHLIGMCSMWIATKFEEQCPMKMEFLEHKVGHNTFKDKEIVLKERQILQSIDIGKIVSTNPQECVSSFIYDFLQNNQTFVNNFKVEWYMKLLETFANYYSKLTCHFDAFSNYPACFKAIGCLLVAYERIKKENYKISSEAEYYVKEWLRYIIRENIYEYTQSELINKLLDADKTYQGLDFIGFNLNKSFYYEVATIKEKFKVEHYDELVLKTPTSSGNFNNHTSEEELL
jgi:hypothetical protein